ncbi:MAG TPA: Pycsar system effector family protein, partial [Gemmataceae bacterium]|nr:Pycsar system effector family protein [Gemmataceae bacterium]
LTLILFAVCSVGAVGMLIYTVMSRFGEKAPKCRIFFGHIATQYGHDFEKYVTELKGMSEDDWLKEVGTQIVETSHIALTKHKTVRNAAQYTLVGLAFWVVSVFSISLLPD